MSCAGVVQPALKLQVLYYTSPTTLIAGYSPGEMKAAMPDSSSRHCADSKARSMLNPRAASASGSRSRCSQGGTQEPAAAEDSNHSVVTMGRPVQSVPLQFKTMIRPVWQISSPCAPIPVWIHPMAHYKLGHWSLMAVHGGFKGTGVNIANDMYQAGGQIMRMGVGGYWLSPDCGNTTSEQQGDRVAIHVLPVRDSSVAGMASSPLMCTQTQRQWVAEAQGHS